jgi:hypothetical protein
MILYYFDLLISKINFKKYYFKIKETINQETFMNVSLPRNWRIQFNGNGILGGSNFI